MKLYFYSLILLFVSSAAWASDNSTHDAFAISGSATAGTVSCNGGTTTVTATATGGIADLTYRIFGTPAAGGSFSVTSTPQPNGGTYEFTGVPAGNYNVTASDGAETITIGTLTIGQPLPSTNNNGAPELVVFSSISPSANFPTKASSINITYFISNKNNTNINAQGVIMRVSKPYTTYTVELDAGSTPAWQKTTDAAHYAEFTLQPGNQITCGTTSNVTVVITRLGYDSASTGLPVTGAVRLPGAAQDLIDHDNARSSQVRVQ